jgi:tetratricopeptide (TPR) repeat protein
MRIKLVSARALILIMAAIRSAHAAAHDDESDSIRRAQILSVHGDFAGAIPILAALASSSPAGLSDQKKAMVWN